MKLILHILLGTIVTTIISACTTLPQTSQQKAEQQLTLRENAARIYQLKIGDKKADVQGIVGIVSNRHIMTYGWDVIETWSVPIDSGYASLVIKNGALSEIKIQKTLFRFARDKSVLISAQDRLIHQTISIVELGWTLSQVESLLLKPTIRLSEQETSDAFTKMRRAFVDYKHLPIFSGMNPDMLSRNIVGMLYIYSGERLSAALLISEGKVSEIYFSEDPTKSQEVDLEQSMQ